MRLIDADALKARFTEELFERSGLSAQGIIDEAPTIAPSGDLISRADAMGAVQDHFNADGFKGYDDGQKMMDRIKELPSADAKSVRSKCEVEIKKVELKDGFKIDDVPQDWKPKVIGNVEVVVRCKDCRYQEHCHETVAHTKDHDGFREHWSEPIEWCSRGERREE